VLGSTRLPKSEHQAVQVAERLLHASNLLNLPPPYSEDDVHQVEPGRGESYLYLLLLLLVDELPPHHSNAIAYSVRSLMRMICAWCIAVTAAAVCTQYFTGYWNLR
jgi:hypothetical protein